MSEKDEAIVRRYYEEVFHAGKMDTLAANFSGVDHIEIHDLFSCGDKVAARWSWSGRHTTEFMGIPATNRLVTMKGIAIFRLAEGKIVELWQEMDIMGILQQVSAPSPAADR
jgi:predicted ester cyclase